MFPQYQEQAADRARNLQQEAAAMRLRPHRARVRHVAAVSLRHLADRLDRAPAQPAAHGR
jgi:hypothetical protein